MSNKRGWILSAEYQDWCDQQGLPVMSADELLREKITAAQREWVIDFIKRWDAMLQAQGVA